MFYKKKRKRGRLVLSICILLLLAGFTYGYISNSKPQNKPNNISSLTENKKTEINNKLKTEKDKEEDKEKDTEESTSQEDTDVAAQREENSTLGIVNENSQIIFNTYYVKTGEVDTKKTNIPINIVGATLNEFKSYIESNYSDWKIRSVSTESASLFKQIDGYKPNNYIIQSKDGYIVIYKINESGEKELYEKTNISTSTLSETDKKKLEKGIFVKTLEDVYNIIEDYSS